MATSREETTQIPSNKIYNIMKLFFQELLAYNNQCNQNFYEVLKGLPVAPPHKALSLFNHILNAHQIWNDRMEIRHKGLDAWELRNFHDLNTIDQANREQTLQILDKFDMDQNVHYTLSNGRSYTNSIKNILFHIINHSTYHRGQIILELKQHGLTTVASDYILFKKLDNK